MILTTVGLVIFSVSMALRIGRLERQVNELRRFQEQRSGDEHA